MNRNLIGALAGLAIGAIVLLGNTFYVVDQRQQAIVLRMGVPDRTVNAAGQDDAGLQVKVPFVETVVRLDRQSQALEVDGQDVRAADQQRLVIDAVLRYRIIDPLAYQRGLGDEQAAQARLQRLISGVLRERIGAMKAADVISSGRAEVTREALGDVAARVKAARIGVQVIDLSLRRAGLPVADEVAIYARMKTERQQEAALIKAQGDQQGLTTRATGDKDAGIIRATAQEDAGRVMGEGDAKRAALYSQTYGRDPQFAEFYRSMQAYEKTIGSGETTVVLSPDSGFLKYFKAGPGK